MFRFNCSIKKCSVKKSSFTGLFFTLLLFLLCNLHFAYAAMPETFSTVAEKTLPGVVNISTTTIVKPQKMMHPFFRLEEFFNNSLPFFDNENSSSEEENTGRNAELSRGTGFIIDSAGLIVTNYHVIEGANHVFVTFNDDSQEIEAEVIGFDKRTDLALLKIDYPTKLPALEFGDPDMSRVGDWIVAIGNPFGLGGTVTTGIISAKARSMQIGYNDLIQTDASINMGNSGGPMLSMDAKVIGVNRIILSHTGANIGIGFAVSTKTVKYVIESIKKHGKVVRPWFGFYFQPLDESIAENLDLQDEKGVIISQIFPGSPADEAGLESGDVLTRIDGIQVDQSNLFSVMLDKQVDQSVEMTILRDSKEIIVEAFPKEEPEKIVANSSAQDSNANSEYENGPTFEDEYQFGIKVKALTDQYRSKFGIENNIEGVLVESVRRGSAAHFTGIRADMVIVKLNKQETKTIESFKEVCEKARTDNKNSTMLLIYYDGMARFVVMRER